MHSDSLHSKKPAWLLEMPSFANTMPLRAANTMPLRAKKKTCRQACLLLARCLRESRSRGLSQTASALLLAAKSLQMLTSSFCKRMDTSRTPSHHKDRQDVQAILLRSAAGLWDPQPPPSPCQTAGLHCWLSRSSGRSSSSSLDHSAACRERQRLTVNCNCNN